MTFDELYAKYFPRKKNDYDNEYKFRDDLERHFNDHYEEYLHVYTLIRLLARGITDINDRLNDI